MLIIPLGDHERISNREKHQRRTQAISNAYLEIIILCTQFCKTIREQRQSSLRRYLKPIWLDRQFDEAVERFRKHKRNVDEEAKICHMNVAAEARNDELIPAASERQHDILSRLSRLDYHYKHRKLKEHRHDGTGAWIISGDAHKEWKTTPHPSSVLCCYGIREFCFQFPASTPHMTYLQLIIINLAGCGKSVIPSSIIDSFTAQEKVTFYYVDYADKWTLDPANLFGTLARQLLHRIAPIPDPLACTIEEAAYDGDRLTDVTRALRPLQGCLELSLSPVYVVIDGLDEMTEQSQRIVYRSLSQLVNKPSSGFKLFLTRKGGKSVV